MWLFFQVVNTVLRVSLRALPFLKSCGLVSRKGKNHLSFLVHQEPFILCCLGCLDLLSESQVSLNSDNWESGNKSICCFISSFISCFMEVLWSLSYFFSDPCIVIFSGGLAQGNNRKGLTLLRGRSKMLLLSDFVVDFVCLCDTPWEQGEALNVLINCVQYSIVHPRI